MIGQTNKPQQILRILEERPYGSYASEIGAAVNLPAASVRRTIGTLRRRGHTILTDAIDGYKLRYPSDQQ